MSKDKVRSTGGNDVGGMLEVSSTSLSSFERAQDVVHNDQTRGRLITKGVEQRPVPFQDYHFILL